MASASAWVTTRKRDTAFEELFTTQYAIVVGIAQRVLGSGHEAEDVAQEVFCSFYRHHSPDVPYAVPWLRRAAAHAALNVVRGNRRRRRREERHTVDHDRVHVLAGSALDPQAQVEIAEQRTEVRAALARLPEKSATVLVLRYSGLSYAEVADALGVGVGQIGTLLRRAEAALHKEMTRETPR